MPFHTNYLAHTADFKKVCTPEKPKKRDDNRHSDDGGKEPVWCFLLNHGCRLWIRRPAEKLAIGST
jgi:hypothetical protein